LEQEALSAWLLGSEQLWQRAPLTSVALAKTVYTMVIDDVIGILDVMFKNWYEV
jgi:hypothetical protein